MIKICIWICMLIPLSACQLMKTDKAMSDKTASSHIDVIEQGPIENLGVIILKLDDLRYDERYDFGVRSGWVDTLALLDSYQIKGTIGLIAEDSAYIDAQDTFDAKHIAYVSSQHKNGHEVWHHGWDHDRAGEKGEFCGHPFERQYRHFHDSLSLVKQKYGITMHSFGTPYNCSDATLTKIFEQQDTIKVFMFGDHPLPNNALNLDKRPVRIESSTGQPDFEYFKDKYIDNLGEEYYVLQGHPKRWVTDSDELKEFSKIIEFLIAQGHLFMTPYQYYLSTSSDMNKK